MAASDGLEGRLKLSYTPLERPAEQIRLLCRCTAGSWSLKVYDLWQAPSYGALSYTWGPPLPAKLVIIDGCTFEATCNCYFALEQLRSRQHTEYFWIDAICINQSDNDEKGPQVQMMADIYTNAACTFISLGEHDSTSQLLFNELKLCEEWILKHHGPDVAYYVIKYSDLKDHWTSTLSTESINALCLAMRDLARRPYWNRLWIYQEILKSRNIMLMSGQEDVVSFRSVQAFLVGIGFCYNQWIHRPDDVVCKHDHESIMRIIIETLQKTFTIDEKRLRIASFRGQNIDLQRLLQQAKTRQCTDPRDMVYGLINLVQWPSDLHKMTVDYNTTAFEVARCALSHYPVDYPQNVLHLAELLVNALQLDHGEDEQSSGSILDHGEIECEALQQHRSKVDIYAVAATELRLNEHGELTASLEFKTKGWDGANVQLSSQTPSQHGSLQRLVNTDFNAHVEEYTPLMLEAQLAGLAYQGCEAGDILVQINMSGRRLHLILRKSTDDTYNLVGQAVLDLNTVISIHTMDDRDRVAFELCLDPKDALLLMLDPVQKSAMVQLQVEDLRRVTGSSSRISWSSYATPLSPHLKCSASACVLTAV
ncbi:Heterokaryon incompatibility protein 6, OR allele [Pseudocercospora fuligena]|uniref:Heterokaryon incompatibility protein 6, OR allele n=1 Tax=Pseudocercospora fuligena TaxID=685502 RepID=A0A8H6VEK7_9PEZI|nr:Heterokaryon incompatibility protein 6, OR allele [Pseudocercospora fuligena]